MDLSGSTSPDVATIALGGQAGANAAADAVQFLWMLTTFMQQQIANLNTQTASDTDQDWLNFLDGGI